MLSPCYENRTCARRSPEGPAVAPFYGNGSSAYSIRGIQIASGSDDTGMVLLKWFRFR